eukprot:SAG31_NODE_30909_length_374_cov_1.505455_1_plen_27_part_01
MTGSSEVVCKTYRTARTAYPVTKFSSR